MPYYIEVFSTDGKACVHEAVCDNCRAGLGPEGRALDAGTAFWYPRHTMAGLESMQQVERYLNSLGRRFTTGRCTLCMDGPAEEQF
jgi:hypothetical protein